MTTVSHHKTTTRAAANVKRADRLRDGLEPIRSWKYSRNKITVHMGSTNHYADAVRAEAQVRNMSVNSFMRAMIRGYFGAALHGK